MSRIPDQTNFTIEFTKKISAEAQQEVAEAVAAAIATDQIAESLSADLRDMARRTRASDVRVEFKGTPERGRSHLKAVLRKQASKHGCAIELEYNGRRFTS